MLGLINEQNAKLWKPFIDEYKPKSDVVWEGSTIQLSVNWEADDSESIGDLVKLYNENEGIIKVLSSDGEIIGSLQERFKLLDQGIYRTEVQDKNLLQVTYWGVGERPFETA